MCHVIYKTKKLHLTDFNFNGSCTLEKVKKRVIHSARSLPLSVYLRLHDQFRPTHVSSHATPHVVASIGCTAIGIPKQCTAHQRRGG